LEFSNFPMFFPSFPEIGSHSCRNRNGFLRTRWEGRFLRIIDTISQAFDGINSFLQLFILKLRTCATPPRILSLSVHILFISYNLIYFDGIPWESTIFYTVFIILLPSVHGVQMCRPGLFRPPAAPPAGIWVRCVCNKALPLLHFAGFQWLSCIFFAPWQPVGGAEPRHLAIYRFFSRNSFSSAKPPRG